MVVSSKAFLKFLETFFSLFFAFKDEKIKALDEVKNFNQYFDGPTSDRIGQTKDEFSFLKNGLH